MRAPADIVLRIFHAVLVCCRKRVEGPRDWPSMRRFLIKNSADEHQAQMKKLLEQYWDLPNAGDAALRRLFSGPQAIDPWAIASLPQVVVIVAVTLQAVYTLREAHLDALSLQREVQAQRAWITRCAAAAVLFAPRRLPGLNAEGCAAARCSWAPAPADAAAAWAAAWGWRSAAPPAPTPLASGPRPGGRPVGRPCRAPPAVPATWVPSDVELRAALAESSAASRREREREKEKDSDDPESTCSGNPSTQEPRTSDDGSSEISFCLSDSMVLDEGL